MRSAFAGIALVAAVAAAPAFAATSVAANTPALTTIGTFGPGTYSVSGTGTSYTFTLGSTATLSALVNDTYYPNNVGAFSVSVAAVPEPVTWAMMIGGFAVAGATLRRRRSVAAVA